MHLRLPIVAAVVALAAGAAALRALQPHPAATQAFASSQPDMVRPRGRTGAAVGRAVLPAIVVYVAGQVARPGLYTVPATARGADALRAAGGPLTDADLVAVNLAARLADGDEIAVPARGASAHRAARAGSRGEPAASRRTRAKHGGRRHRRSAASEATSDTGALAESPAEPIDLNTADSDALETLPGIGPALAERIIAVRDQSGPFAAPDDLLDIGGMTQSKLDSIAPYITLR
jgi:competence protein ComEA